MVRDLGRMCQYKQNSYTMKITSKAVADGESFGKSCEQMPVCYYVNVWFLQGLHAFRINSKGDCQQSQGSHCSSPSVGIIYSLILHAGMLN